MNKTKMNISPDLSLSLSTFITDTQAIVAIKGMGKTHLAQVEAEEVLSHGHPIIAIDPTDAWWGLQSSADGARAGFPIAVFGGKHGNLPLDPAAGVELADAVVSERFSCVLCTKGLPAGKEVRFVREFLERVYRTNREPIHIFIDEADMFAPQKPFDPEDAQSIRTMSNIVRRGRNEGIGCTLITQRPAVLNKDVLAMCDLYMVLGMSLNLDIDAIRGHVRNKRNPELADELVDSLPTLQVGDAWAWAPRKGIHKRFRARPKTTFDSGATPKVGEKPRTPRVLSKIDLERLSKRMASAVEQVKANDPKHLKARVAELEKQLAAKPSAKVQTETKTIERFVLKDGQLKRAESAILAFEKLIARWDSASAEVQQKMAASVLAAVTELAAMRIAIAKTNEPHAPRVAPAPTAPIFKPHKVAAPAVVDGEALSSAKQRILNALAALEVIGVRQADKTQLALFAEQSPTSSGYTHNLGALRTVGLVDYPAPSCVALTDDGRRAADSSAAPRTTAEMHAYVQRLLGSSRWNVLTPLIAVHPNALTKEELAERARVSASSSGYTHNLGALRSLGLLDYPRPGEVRAADLLFIEGAS